MARNLQAVEGLEGPLRQLTLDRGRDLAPETRRPAAPDPTGVQSQDSREEIAGGE
jgi:hypothetical protein